ncbi:nucleoside transporter [Opitutaceae bacterium EW11]|nr:nucleoside transporter [Opitutaceae bacterium EW11]
MSFREFTHLSPNRALEPVNACQGVLFHHTVLSFSETLAKLSDPASQVSYHGIISKTGERCVLVRDAEIAWHAGVSSFRGQSGCNRFLLGLAFEGDTYRYPLTNAQLQSVLEWLVPRWIRYGWSLEWMIDHRQVAPGRKNDLNPSEWQRLLATIEGAVASGALVTRPPG